MAKPDKTIADIMALREAFELEFERKHGRRPTEGEYQRHAQDKERARLLHANGLHEVDGRTFISMPGEDDAGWVNNASNRTRV